MAVTVTLRRGTGFGGNAAVEKLIDDAVARGIITESGGVMSGGVCINFDDASANIHASEQISGLNVEQVKAIFQKYGVPL